MSVFLSLVRVPALLVLAGVMLTAQTASPADPLIKDLRWRNIGNANLIGRISAIDALESDWTHVVVGSAGGGVFKSTTGGIEWRSIFDHYGAASIGDVKINQRHPNIIWVGTGEECGRNTASWGDGVYRSTDGGETFVKAGLSDTFNIGSIVLHPDDPDTAYVAAIGNIYGPIGRRGAFKTTDGGATWTTLTDGLPSDPQTGAIDMVMDPTNPDILYVAFWQRVRYPWMLKSGGPNGGLFKSTDGGNSWQALTLGLPEGDLGKIGLAIARSNPRVVMAHIEHGFQPDCPTDRVNARGRRGGSGTRAERDPACDDLTQLGSGLYRSEDAGLTWTFVNRYTRRPFYYNHLAISPLDDQYVFSFNLDYRRSRDGGRTFDSGGGGEGGHCWHAMWHDPHNKSRYYLGSDGGLNLTHDDGVTDLRFTNLNVTQYYDIGLTMAEPYWVCGGLQDAGSSCGPSMTRAGAIYTSDWVSLSAGDGHHAESPPDRPHLVITETQPGRTGGNIGVSNLVTRERRGLRPNKNNILNWNTYITPAMERLAEDRNWGRQPNQLGVLRFNWSTPVRLSPHDSQVLYVGANHLLVSPDFGDTWRIASPDLSKNDPERTVRRSGGLTPDEDAGGGAEYYGTLVTIAPSPIDPATIWVGTDDGNIHVTRDNGTSWRQVGSAGFPGLPRDDFWVSRVEASHHAPGTAYVTITGHRMANYEPFVYSTSDYGRTWTRITEGIPGGIPGNPMYVIKEDNRNPNLLFAGSEFGAFYSLDAGVTWRRLNATGGPSDRTLPTVAVHDVEVHARDADLVVATHGRGFWILDDITPLQQMTPVVQASDAHLFENRIATQWLHVQPQHDGGALAFRGRNPTRNAVIHYYLSARVTGSVEVSVHGTDARDTCQTSLPAHAGIGRLEWTMHWSGSADCLLTASQADAADDAQGHQRRDAEARLAGPGTYQVTMTANGRTHTSTITLRIDPLLAGNREAGGVAPRGSVRD